LPVLVRGTAQMKQGETGLSLRHAPGKFLVIGRFLEKIVSALLPFLTMLISARFIDLVLNQRMEEAIRDVCLLGALILCQRLGGLYSRMWKAQAENYVVKQRGKVS